MHTLAPSVSDICCGETSSSLENVGPSLDRGSSSPAGEIDQQYLWNDLHRQYWGKSRQLLPNDLALGLTERLNASKKILELGCGNGHDAVFLQSCGHSVTATDFSGFAIGQNRRRFEASGVHFVEHNTLKSFPFPDGHFDVVYARLSLHYFSDPDTRTIFGEVSRVLRPGGTLLFTCRSTQDPLCGQGEALGPSIYRHEGQVRHFFSSCYATNLLTSRDAFEIVALDTRKEEVYGSAASVVHCLARRL